MAILKRIQTLTLPFALSLLLTGCFQEFEPDVDTTPVLCVNSLILPGEPIVIKVTHSTMYSNAIKHNYTNAGQTVHNSVNDAKIYIYVNGELKSEEYLPKEGDSIDMVVESARYGTARASVVVPAAVPISVTEIFPRVTDIWNDPDYAIKTTIHFNLQAQIEIGQTSSDVSYFQIGSQGYDYKGDQSDYYLYGNGFLGDDLIDEDPFVNFRFALLDSDSAPIFKEYFTSMDDVLGSDDGTFLNFTNRQFRGKGYGFSTLFKDNYVSIYSEKYDSELFDCKVVFTLKSVSRSYFNFSLYQWERENGYLGQFEDTGLADPMWGYSNVSTGAGVVAAYSVSTCTISLRDFLETAFKDARPEWKECRIRKNIAREFGKYTGNM